MNWDRVNRENRLFRWLDGSVDHGLPPTIAKASVQTTRSPDPVMGRLSDAVEVARKTRIRGGYPNTVAPYLFLLLGVAYDCSQRGDWELAAAASEQAIVVAENLEDSVMDPGLRSRAMAAANLIWRSAA